LRWLTGDDESKAASVAEQVIGVAKQVTGLDDAEAAASAIRANPELATKLRLGVMEHERAWWREETKRLESVNQTMREETKAEDPWSRRWRPFWGFVSAVVFGVVCVYVLILLHIAIIRGDANAMAALPNVIIQLTMLFGVPAAILGIASWGRSKAQVERVRSDP
jgi:hypothetical protein